MSDIKFACSSCGQKIKCDSGHAGMRIACPSCGVDLDIPAAADAAGTSSRIHRSAGAAPAPRPEGVPLSNPSPSSPPAARPSSSPVPEAVKDVRCLCPVCRSELKVQTPAGKGGSTGTLPVAELVRPGSVGRFAPPSPATAARGAPTHEAGAPTADKSSASAAAPAEKPIHPHLGAKPRLSYVLTGKPPAPLPRPDGTPRRKAKGGAASGSPPAPG
jgi:hypothetical protein